MKRKKATKDFAKKKKKLGKGKKLPDNATVTSFKSHSIHLPIQLEESRGPTTHRNLSLSDLVRHLHHPKHSVRKDGLTGLRELFLSNLPLLESSVGEIIKKSSPLFVDHDIGVRHSLYLLLKHVFQVINEKSIKPFYPLLLASLKCGLTHIDSSIQVDSLKITDLLITHYPSLIKESINNLIPLYLPLVAMKTNKQLSKGKSNKSDVISLYVAKQPVLSQLLVFMSLMNNKNNEATPIYSTPVINASEGKVWPDGDCLSVPRDLSLFYESSPFLFIVNPRLFHPAVCGLQLESPHSKEAPYQCVPQVTELENKLVKALLELWIEIVSGSLMDTPTGTAHSDLCILMSTIIQLLCSLVFNNLIDEVKFQGQFTGHFVPYFPLFGKDGVTAESLPNVFMLNLYFSRLFLAVAKPHPQSKLINIQPVVNYLVSQLPKVAPSLLSADLVECVSVITSIIHDVLTSSPVPISPTVMVPLFSACHSLFISCHPQSAAKLSFLSFINTITHQHFVPFSITATNTDRQLFLDHFLYPCLSELPGLLQRVASSTEHVKLVIQVLKTALSCQIDPVVTEFKAKSSDIYGSNGVLHCLPSPIQQYLLNLKTYTQIRHN